MITGDIRTDVGLNLSMKSIRDKCYFNEFPIK